LGVLLEAALQQAFDARRRDGWQRSQVWIALENGRERIRRRETRERISTGPHLEQDAAERPDISTLVHRGTTSLLRAHIGYRAQHDAAARCVRRRIECLAR